MNMKNRFVRPASATDKRYRAILKEITDENVCPLCPETMRWHTKPILKRRKGWYITENFNPYKNANRHFLIIDQLHKERFEKLSADDWAHIVYLANWAIKTFRIKGGGMAMRFGSPRLTGASVTHLHAHLITPKILRGKTQSVSFPIG